MINAVTIDKQPDILALDFDGVLCDGLIEYFQTAWRAYCHIYSISDPSPPADLAEQFNYLRPVIETGWEMPMLIHALVTGIPSDDVATNWPPIAQQQAQATGLTTPEIAAVVDRIRDEWIAADVEHWLAQHRFYPGVLQRLQETLASSVTVVIITTKEGRFVHRLLQQQNVEIAPSRILGKEVKQPKAQTLRELLQASHPSIPPVKPSPTIWFIEDRLKTLQTVQIQPDLAQIQLFLADWGYNTAIERETAQQSPRIQLLSLPVFAQPFANWPGDSPSPS